MNASDPIKIIKEFLQGGGRPHGYMDADGGPVTSSEPLLLMILALAL